VTRVVLAALRAYQHVVSPLLPRACRFAPTCSEYARLALLEHGLGRGGWLALRRILKCHPFHRGGYDPPPARQGHA
jgi:putative membrane protein insertion efficiency factor